MRETPGGEIEVSPFGFGWWTAGQLARLAWYASLLALAFGLWLVWTGNRLAVLGVAVASATLALTWAAEAIVFPSLRRRMR